ncbi:hypothetical protein [Chitinophaga sp. Cy-1792]|uniref:hypothetical protein n=1 Tax=Chitinophaga sp. Cy-1792 TaxID=2608339 RepID=UPI00141E422C|nr:hypothetical protein [Chitinophaga sp. Cy-1792]NIG52800.1 hypothetical protein [Chitinophaga sp. Cy-1792]
MKKILWLSMLVFCMKASAQVSMTPLLPSGGVLLKAQLWNVRMVSVSANPVYARILFTLRDVRNNQVVMTAATKTFSLDKGARQMQVNDFAPIQYEILSPVMDRNPNGMIAAGNYLACYNLVVEGDKRGQGGEDCIPFSVEPMSPPLLNNPADRSMLDSRLPQFTWIPPAPVNIFNDLNYRMIVTEVFPGQDAYEAVQQNVPVYQANNLRLNYVNFADGAMNLDTAKTYAWTVIAKNTEMTVSQAEVWTFRLKQPLRSSGVSQSSYVQLKRTTDGTVINCNERLLCQYTNETTDSTASFELIDLDHHNKVVYKGSIPVDAGSNQLELLLDKDFHLVSDRNYLFRIQNSRNDSWMIKFHYQRSERQ